MGKDQVEQRSSRGEHSARQKRAATRGRAATLPEGLLSPNTRPYRQREMNSRRGTPAKVHRVDGSVPPSPGRMIQR